MQKINLFLKNYSEAGIFLLRLFAGIRLIYGVWDNIISWSRMLEFRDFLQHTGFPFPLVCAIVSVYAQMIAGVLFIVGWKTRAAAFIMVINFFIAWFMVHRNQSFEEMTASLFFLFVSVLLLFQGAGRWSVDGKANPA